MDLVLVVDGDPGEVVEQLQRAEVAFARRRLVVVAAESRAQQVDDELNGTCVTPIIVIALSTQIASSTQFTYKKLRSRMCMQSLSERRKTRGGKEAVN